MAGIAKKAKGLQRFMLDCGFWQSPSWRGLRRCAEIGLMAAAVSYCNEHLTDGELPAPIDELASSLALQAKDVRKPLTNFLNNGKWVEKDGNYTIVGYLEHNPSRTEVMDDRRRRATAAAKANHERWHVEKGVIDPDCDLCPSHNGSHPPSESDQKRDVGDIPCEASEVTEGSKASELKDAKHVSPSSSSMTEEPLLRPNPDDDDPPEWAWKVAERQADEPRRPSVEPIHDRQAWISKAARRAHAQHGAEVATWTDLQTGAAIAARIFNNTRTETGNTEPAIERLRRLGLAEHA